MNKSYYPLEPPVEKIVVQRVVKFTINNLNITLFSQATLTAVLYNIDDVLLDCIALTLSGQEYLDWNSSDEYLINWTSQQIRLQYDVKVIEAKLPLVEESHVKLIIEELIIEEPIIAENILSL